MVLIQKEKSILATIYDSCNVDLPIANFTMAKQSLHTFSCTRRVQAQNMVFKQFGKIACTRKKFAHVFCANLVQTHEFKPINTCDKLTSHPALARKNKKASRMFLE